MDDITYGELLARAQHHLVRAALDAGAKLADVEVATAAVDGHAKFISAVRANLRVVTALPGIDDTARHRCLTQATTDLSIAINTFLDSPVLRDLPAPAITRTDDTPGNDWDGAAKLLRVAADTLGSHLGPQRAYRTPDAHLLDDPDTQQTVVQRLAEMTLTAGAAQQHLALRVHEAAAVQQDALWLGAAADRLLDTHEALTAAAAQVIAIHQPPTAQHAVERLPAAPLLRPTRASDPITAARQAFDRIRVLAHRQARGEIPTGIDAIHAYSTTAALAAMHAHAIAAAAAIASKHGRLDSELARPLRNAAHALAEARTPWMAVMAATEHCTSIRSSPRLLAHELNVLAENLTKLTRNGSHWRAVDDLLPDAGTATRLLGLAAHMASRLPDLANATSSVVDRLHSRGDLLMPTRERDDIDHPYPWAPIDIVRLTALRSATMAADTFSRAASAAVNVLPPHAVRTPGQYGQQADSNLDLTTTSIFSRADLPKSARDLPRTGLPPPECKRSVLGPTQV